MKVLPRRVDALAEESQPTLLSVLQWNILADGLAQSGDFLKVDPKWLEWDYRRSRIIEGILSADADVVCLQECNHFDDILDGLVGYAGFFEAKPTSVCTKLGYPADGLALFYRESRFTLAEGVEPNPRFTCYTDEAGEVQNQLNLRVALRDGETGNEVLVATTHLKAKNGEAESKMRALQVRQLMDDLERESGSRSVVLAGDFNTNAATPPIEYVGAHPLGLKSVLQEFPGEEGECWTTWKFRSAGEKKDAIDYIWYSRGLEPVEKWATPTAEEVGANALPSESYPSDHLALLCRFKCVR